jgi:hypothetical protein
MLLAAMATAACSSGGGTAGAGGAGGTGGSSSGGGTGGGGSQVTTLDGSRALNALSATEATQLCDNSYAYFGTAIPLTTICKWRGLAYAASSSAPSQDVLRSNCTSKETSCQGTDPWANNLGCNDLPSTCTATVAEYSACIRDQVTAFIQTVTAFPMCTALMSTDTAALFEAMAGGTPPASCASLNNACPDLFPPSPLNI